jgi:DNA invertase Pin-like site-specific DNA recombinase
MGGHHDHARALNVDRAGGFAEFERELIRARTGEGRARAVVNGVRLGRKPTLTHRSS